MTDYVNPARLEAARKIPFTAIVSYIIAYVLLDQLSFVGPIAPVAITAWNPPPSLSIAFLVVFGIRYWPALLVAALIAEVGMGTSPGPGYYTIVSAIFLVAGYASIAFLLKRRLQGRANLTTLRDLAWFMVFTALISLLTAAGYVGVFTVGHALHAEDFLFNAMVFWIGDVIGTIVTTPALLLLWHFLKQDAKSFEVTGEMAFQVAALLFAVWIVFALRGSDEFRFFYVIFVPLIWIAVRKGFPGAVIAIVFIQVVLLAWAYLLNEESVTVLERQILMLTVAVAGQFLGMAATERGNALAALREREEELQHALRLAAASELYSAIAHELNQPLAAVSHFAWAGCQLAERKDFRPDEVAQLLKEVASEARRAAAITQRLRDLYLRGVVRRDRVTVGQLIDDAMAQLVSSLNRRNIGLRLSITDPLLTVVVDPIQISAVLHNIVSNGIDAVEEFRRDRVLRGEVLISAACEDNMLTVCVDDSGRGIPAEMQNRVFAAFATTKKQGLGLGLAICRSIVEAHQGRIWVEASALGGARFCFTLPFEVNSDARDSICN